MRLSPVALAALVLAGPAYAAPYKPSNPVTHLRPTSRHAAELLADGMAASATIRRLVSRIEASDVIVYIEALPGLRPGVSGTMRFVTATPRARFLRVQVNTRHPRTLQIAVLGHELRHVVEIADEPGIRTESGLHDFYRRTGVRTGVDSFDSSAAQQAGYAVREELLAARRGMRYARVTPDDDRALRGGSIADDRHVTY